MTDKSIEKKSLHPAGSKQTEEEESLSGYNCEYLNQVNLRILSLCKLTGLAGLLLAFTKYRDRVTVMLI